MKVYIVFKLVRVPYSEDGNYVEKIFLDEEKANEYADECNKNNIWHFESFYVNEYEIEE